MSQKTKPGTMTCQLCGGSGEHTKVHLVGDGQINVETRLENETVECQCDNGVIKDPMTTVGLYLGKFAPFHGGHRYCLDQALDDCDHVIVLVYYTDEIDVPLQVRANWIRDLYDDEVNGGSTVDGATLDVVEAWTGPESHGYTDNIKSEHEQYVLQLLEQRGYPTDVVDRFYSSEPYGEHMSEALDADDVRVDPDREVQPISGTQIREDGMAKHSRMLPYRVDAGLTSRIAIVGGVSSGKTTLATALARHYDTEWMPEHGREFWEEHADENGRLTEDELVQLALEHTDREDELAQDAGEYLFVDTTPMTTLAWAKYYHGTEPETLVQMTHACNSMYDLHVLCDPHIPFEDDPGRDGRANRKRLHRMHRALMNEYNIDYITVGGSVEQRVAQVEKALTKHNVGLHDRVATAHATNRWDR